jgi:hypothetical protein
MLCREGRRNTGRTQSRRQGNIVTRGISERGERRGYAPGDDAKQASVLWQPKNVSQNRSLALMVPLGKRGGRGVLPLQGAQVPWVLRRHVCGDARVHPRTGAPEGGAPAYRTVHASRWGVGSHQHHRARAGHLIHDACVRVPTRATWRGTPPDDASGTVPTVLPRLRTQGAEPVLAQDLGLQPRTPHRAPARDGGGRRAKASFGQEL